MTINFSDHFWGEKNAGFDVLYHNQKNSLISTKELLEFFRERSKLEEASSTQLGKLVSRSSNGANHGSFAPLWQALKTTTEKLSSLHSQMVQKVQELIKDVAKYSEDLHKKHKQVKDEESGTQDAVQLIQVTNANLQKTCLIYQQKHAEWEKLKNEGNASPKELERAEAKCKKALEDYKNFVDKYNSVRSDFERKMTQSCEHFQDLEMSHLRQMKEFISSYSDMMQSNYGLIGQVHGELRHQCDDLTVEKLIEQFVELKKTGSEIPPEASVEEVGVAKPVETLVDVTWMHPETSSMGGNSVSGSSLGGGGDLLSGLSAPPMVNDTPSADQTPPKLASKKEGGCKLSVEKSRVNSSDGPSSANHDESMLRGTFRGSKWFLKSRRKKKDKKKDSEVENVQENKLPNDDRSKSNLMDLPLGKPERASPPAPENVEVDNEGFSVPPTAFPATERRRSSFSSSSGSGSDSDSDDDKRVVPMVEIKPLGPGIPLSSASVDELRAVMEGITLGGSGVRASPTIVRRKSRKRALTMPSRSFDSQPVNLITQTSRIDNQVPRRLPNSPLTVSSNSETTKLSNDVTALGNRSDTPPELAKRIPPTSPTSLGSSSSGFVDLFKQWGEAPPVIPPKQGASATSDGLSSGGSSIAIPRPPRRSDLSTTLLRGRSTNSSTSLSRADSLGSLASFAASEFKLSGPAPGGPTPPILTSSSRGPSPLTIGMSDTIPIAVAFQEMVHAYFRGSDDSKCQVKLIGDLVMSFPSGIVYALTNNPSPPPLVFCIKNTAKLNSILANKQLLSLVPNQSTPTSPVYEFKMSSLIDHLKRQAEAFPNSHYFNVDILKYQIKSGPGANSAPYQLVTYWKCESTHTDLRIDYKYNGKAAMASPAALLNLSVSVPVDGGVKSMHARPVGKWMEESKRAQWKFTELSSHSEKGGTGSLRARFELTTGPGSPGTVTCQFNCEGTTLSGAEFQLVGTGYRVSLTKKKLVAGKYICDPEVCPPRSSSATPGSNGGERYAAPPGENRYAAPPSETRYAAPPSETRYAAPPGDSRYAAPPSIPQPSTSSPKNASAPTPV